MQISVTEIDFIIHPHSACTVGFECNTTEAGYGAKLFTTHPKDGFHRRQAISSAKQISYALCAYFIATVQAYGRLIILSV